MRKKLFFLIAAVSIICLLSAKAYAGEVDVLLNKLVEKGVLTPSEAQIVADDTKLKVSRDLAEQKSYSVPDWTQRIKWGGDVRFRTRGDWAQSTVPATSAPAYGDQQWANQMRGRFYMDAQVNDFTHAFVRLAGNSKANSTNDTFNNYWNKAPVYFDMYYIMFNAPKEVQRDYGKYFSDAKLWLGRIPNPFQYSEMVWDPDINPEGVALQYVSPDIKIGNLPAANLYTNGGMFWLDQNTAWNADHYPMLWVLQGGIKTDKFGPLASTVNVSTAIYDFASMTGKYYNGSAGTSGGAQYTANAGTNSRDSLGAWRYNYELLDVLVQIDNDKILDYEFPHGLYGDFIKNPACSDDTVNNGFLIGGYIGKKNVKEPGDWKIKGEMRYIERDAIPDFMPDSDFYGFGTWNTTNNMGKSNNNGLPLGGGTNGKGFVLGADYVLFKNTVLNVKWYWMKPIKSDDITSPWGELQMDVVTKF